MKVLILSIVKACVVLASSDYFTLQHNYFDNDA